MVVAEALPIKLVCVRQGSNVYLTQGSGSQQLPVGGSCVRNVCVMGSSCSEDVHAGIGDLVVELRQYVVILLQPHEPFHLGNSSSRTR